VQCFGPTLLAIERHQPIQFGFRRVFGDGVRQGLKLRRSLSVAGKPLEKLPVDLLRRRFVPVPGKGLRFAKGLIDRQYHRSVLFETGRRQAAMRIWVLDSRASSEMRLKNHICSMLKALYFLIVLAKV
jgi:hypothetical protein